VMAEIVLNEEMHVHVLCQIESSDDVFESVGFVEDFVADVDRRALEVGHHEEDPEFVDNVDIVGLDVVYSPDNGNPVVYDGYVQRDFVVDTLFELFAFFFCWIPDVETNVIVHQGDKTVN